MIHVTAAFVAQAGKETQLHSVLTAMLEPTRNEQGCLRYVLLKDKNDATKFLFQELFADQAAFDFHCDQPYFHALLAKLDGLLAQEPGITFFESAEVA
ncbi:TPA: putative quinol monooxygenase [Vibrio vulnificus]|uniref:putative quinol monooxygenase n=1 Tax=Vibrio vulnificus TaxID=672 RepID=UPI0019D45C8C|nr:putative quinol monooxygenase [Vibrio vulnificus]MBN8088443.1 antibiotic biosynthesis monooxygenase [Vibrio vulnificus]MBN8117485.1 antibiotic biosynthesis monooxygenase [Vibrio vulnificus]HAS6279631.1 antibiotic biosynthesis monooxygenase [Vibrio vulnificus]HDY7587120.1 antibiotic biosynthesis monooxygenase [Vibrio vulnificus]